MDVAVAENHALVDIGNGVHSRADLPFQVNEGVDLTIDHFFKVHDLFQAPHEGRIRVARGLHFFLPGRRGDTAGHFPQAGDLRNVGIDTLVEAVCLTEIFLCRHTPYTSRWSFSISTSPSREVSV